MWFTLYQKEAEKFWFMTYMTLFPHMKALFMMSLTQTAGHKMAALVVMFLRLGNMDF